MAKKEVKSTKKENSKNKKSFFKDFKAELKKVIWPTPKQLFNSTVAVITIVLVTAAIVFVLDIAFESMNKYGVEKIKSSIAVNTSNSQSANTSTNSSDNEASTTETNTENVIENNAE